MLLHLEDLGDGLGHLLLLQAVDGVLVVPQLKVHFGQPFGDDGVVGAREGWGDGVLGVPEAEDGEVLVLFLGHPVLQLPEQTQGIIVVRL